MKSRLSKPQILLLHEQLIAETGRSSGLRDERMPDSALNAPFQTFGGEDAYPSLQQKAAKFPSPNRFIKSENLKSVTYIFPKKESIYLSH